MTRRILLSFLFLILFPAFAHAATVIPYVLAGDTVSLFNPTGQTVTVNVGFPTTYYSGIQVGPFETYTLTAPQYGYAIIDGNVQAWDLMDGTWYIYATELHLGWAFTGGPWHGLAIANTSFFNIGFQFDFYKNGDFWRTETIYLQPNSIRAQFMHEWFSFIDPNESDYTVVITCPEAFTIVIAQCDQGVCQILQPVGL